MFLLVIPSWLFEYSDGIIYSLNDTIRRKELPEETQCVELEDVVQVDLELEVPDRVCRDVSPPPPHP